jgi:MutS domain V/GIY-YIG catalytic domain
MFLLTAPNMSGKSTLMRATAAASLLSICGLCAPLESDSAIRRFDHIFVRGASSDVPSENLSAFGAEVLDVSALLRCCSSDSLVFVDELGRGTSPRDGTSIAAAVVEAMAQKGMSGIFATHLHEIFDLPLKDADRVKNKRMALATGEDRSDLSTFRLEDGICTDSLAMVTASRFGFPAAVLERAQEFSNMLAADDSVSKVRGKPSMPLATSASGVRTLDDAICALSSINGCEGMPVVIPAEWNPPPSLEGTSCVYILALEDDSTRFYVGETDSLSQRLRQHRAKGGAWSKFSAAVYRIREGKSRSRSVESLVIRALATGGFDMVSIVDGRSVRRGVSNP